MASCWQNNKLRTWLRDQGLEMATDLLTTKVLSWYLMDESHLEGTGFSTSDDLTIDHVVPQQLGGPCCIYNFVLMKRSTNSYFGKYYSKEKEALLGPTICAAAENVIKLIRRQGLERAEITHFDPMATLCPQATRKRKRRAPNTVQKQSVSEALKISIDCNPPKAEIARLIKCADGYAEHESKTCCCKRMPAGASLPAVLSKDAWVDGFVIISCKASGQPSQDFANLRTVARVVNEWSHEYGPGEWYEYKDGNGAFRVFASTRASDALERVANQIEYTTLMKMRKRSPADYAGALIGLLETANEDGVSPEVLEGYRAMLRSTHALQSAADAATLKQFREAADRFRELKRKEIEAN